jgi:hypothetical protein
VDILFKGNKIGTSLLPLSVGDTWDYDGVTYVVLLINKHTENIAIVKEA